MSSYVDSAVVGRLPDGTPYFAPLGELPYDADEDRVQCHLCGGWFRLIGGTHLRVAHGWTLQEYRERFYLLQEIASCAKGVSDRQRAHTRRRMAAGDVVPVQPVKKPKGTGGRGVRRERSLGAMRPDLAAELDPTRNLHLDPFTVGVRSGKKLWWRCSRCGADWEAAPHGRAIGEGCPVCGRARAARKNSFVSTERSLALKRPDLAAELHPTRNPGLDPYALGPSSRQRVWWRCSHCGHEWCVSPDSRRRGHGCPECARRRFVEASRRRCVPHERTLAVVRPELAAELHPTRNPDIDPLTLAASSNRTVWWCCARCGHEWQAQPNDRKRGRKGCLACRGDQRSL